MDICRLLQENIIPKKELDRVFEESDAGAELDCSFLCFEDVYFHVREHISEDFTIIDLGCAYAPQSYIFADCKRYIGVNCSELKAKFDRSGNSEFITADIRDFCDNILPGMGLDMDKTVAICSYVPHFDSEDACAIIKSYFKHYYVKYCEFQMYSEDIGPMYEKFWTKEGELAC